MTQAITESHYLCSLPTERLIGMFGIFHVTHTVLLQVESMQN